MSLALIESKMAQAKAWLKDPHAPAGNGKCSTTWFILTETRGERARVLEVVHEASGEHK